MNIRPTSVTVIAWISILLGAISAASTVAMIDNPIVIDQMKTSPIPIPLQYTISPLGSMVMVASGIAMLKGRNWARFLFLIWSAITLLLIGLVTSPIKAILIPRLVLLAIITFLLFRPTVNSFFSESKSSDDAKQRNHPTMRSLFSVLLNIIAGFFFYMVSVFSFVNMPAMAAGKWWIALVFTIPALIALWGGLALKGFRSWRRTTGIVLLSSSGVTLFIVIAFASLLTSNEFRLLMPPETVNLFNDYVPGSSVIVCIGLLGFLLLKANNATAQPYAPANAEMPRR
jgi:cell division protein FtsW (lipid II flippase)